MADEDVKVQITGDDSGLISTLKRINQQVDKSSKQWQKDFGQIEKVAGRVRGAIAAGAAVFGGAGVIGMGTRELAEGEAAWNRLESQLDNVGISYQSVEGHIRGLGDRLEMTTRFVDDDAAIAFERLIGINRDYHKSVSLVNLVLDVAVKRNMDVASAADLVGRASVGNTRLLRQIGIEAKTSDSALKQLQERFGGFAARDGRTIGAQLAQLSEAGKKLTESFAGAVLGKDPAQAIGDVALAIKGLAAGINEHGDDIHLFFRDTATVIKTLLTPLRGWVLLAQEAHAQAKSLAVQNTGAGFAAGKGIAPLTGADGGAARAAALHARGGFFVHGLAFTPGMVQPRKPQQTLEKTPEQLEAEREERERQERERRERIERLKRERASLIRDPEERESALRLADEARIAFLGRFFEPGDGQGAPGAPGLAQLPSGRSVRGLNDVVLRDRRGNRFSTVRERPRQGGSDYVPFMERIGGAEGATMLGLNALQNLTSGDPLGGLFNTAASVGFAAGGPAGLGIAGAASVFSMFTRIFGSSREREEEQYRAHARALREQRDQTPIVNLHFPKGAFYNTSDPDFQEAIMETVELASGNRVGRFSLVFN